MLLHRAMIDHNPAMSSAHASAVPILTYEDHSRAYRVGYRFRLNSPLALWTDALNALEQLWEASKGPSRLSWRQAQHVVRAGWNRANESVIAHAEARVVNDVDLDADSRETSIEHNNHPVSARLHAGD